MKALLTAEAVPVRRKGGGRRAVRYSLWVVSIYLLLAVGSVIAGFPLFWMVTSAMKESHFIFIQPPQWIPDPFAWDNFPRAWLSILPFFTFLRNSLIISLGNVLAVGISSSIIAYGFARLQVRESGVLFILVLATMMVPEQVLIIPQFLLYSKLGWVNTWLPLMVPWWFGDAFHIFLLRQFFLTLPRELDDAARIDGAGTFGILWRIILPLSKPALAVVAVFTFIYHWNNFFYPLVFLGDRESYTLQLGLNLFRGRYSVRFAEMMAVSVLVLIPVLVIFFLAQQYFIRGIALTGIKG